VSAKSIPFYRSLIATLVFSVATVIRHKKGTRACDGVGLLGIAWAFGGMMYVVEVSNERPPRQAFLLSNSTTALSYFPALDHHHDLHRSAELLASQHQTQV
jgi:hypothetical protein